MATGIPRASAPDHRPGPVVDTAEAAAIKAAPEASRCSTDSAMDVRAVVRDTNAMLGNMTPVLQPGKFVFHTTNDASQASACLAQAIATFRESEGWSCILPLSAAQAIGLDCQLPMQQITLMVHSALDGVGLTAAVAQALAEHGIPCNMVAAFHHDHVFVPVQNAQAALDILIALQRQAS